MRYRVSASGGFDYICATGHEVAALLTGIAVTSGHSATWAEEMIDRTMTTLHSLGHARCHPVPVPIATPAELGDVTVRRLEGRRAG